MVGSCEPGPASAGEPHRPPKATKNTTGVMFEPSQGVLEASRRVPQRTRGLQEYPRTSWSILEASRNVFQAFPGRSRVRKKPSFVDLMPPGGF